MFALDAPETKDSTRGGLLSVANVIDGGSPYLFVEPQEYQTGFTGTNREIPADGVDKIFDERPENTDTVLFGHYRGIDLELLEGQGVGGPLVREAFEASEGIAVEEKVQELLLNPIAIDLTPTPGTPFTNLKAALGILEQYAARNYVGKQPTISGNLFTTYLIPELQAKPDGSLSTIHGTPIAAAAGFDGNGPGAAAVADGTGWLYISGQINIWRSALGLYPGLALEKNREVSLVERRYASSVEGFVAAILVGT